MRKVIYIGLFVLTLLARRAFADNLPVFSIQPSNQIVVPGNTISLTASATGATTYQWRFNGADVSGATISTLQVPNAQTNNSGYYNVIAVNSLGRAPSQLAYVSVVGSNGIVPFSNEGNANAQAKYVATYFLGNTGNWPVTNGTAQVYAGPQLDQLQLVGLPVGYRSTPVGRYLNNGYFSGGDQLVPTVPPGQTVYYSVLLSYTGPNSGVPRTQRSSALALVAGGNGSPVPSATSLLFPTWLEWDPEPDFFVFVPANQTKVVGETTSLQMQYYTYDNSETVFNQWRRDGALIAGATNRILSLTNIQPADAGVYDDLLTVVDGFPATGISPKFYISVQTTNGQGVFQSPRCTSSNFVSDLLGAAGRNYKIQYSTNLTNWNDLNTVSNISGTITVTNSLPPGDVRFYRTLLLP